MAEWPTDPDEPVHPALAPLIDVQTGDAEGYQAAERDLIAGPDR